MPYSVEKPHLPVRICKPPNRCGNRSYQCGAANYPVPLGGSIGPRIKIYVNSGLPIGMVPRFYIRNQKKATGMDSPTMYCYTPLINRIYLCGSAYYPVSWGQYRAENGNLRKFGPTNPHGTAFAPNNISYQKEAKGMENS